MSGITLTWLAGMGLLFFGERLFSESTLHWFLSGGGLALVGLGLVLRVQAKSDPDPGRARGQSAALTWQGVATASLVLYALTTEGATSSLGLDEDAAARWSGAISALWPIVWLLGTAPLVLVDRALNANPMVLPLEAPRAAVQSGVAAALAVALVFPVNYLAHEHDVDWDYAYFRTTRPGTSTMALVRSLSEPITVYLFFAPGSDVKREAETYFEDLADASGGLLIVKTVDQPLEPELSEQLKIRENGYVALVQGEANEKFKLGTELDKAKRSLKKLDETAQKHLLKLAKGPRTAYLMAGHGEASTRERDNPLRKLSLFQKILQSQNYKVDNFTVAEGSTDAVPEDAAFVAVIGPERELLPEEVQVLKDYADKGGRLLLQVEPGQEPMTDLLAHLGVKVGSHPLANATKYMRQTRGNADRVLLATNKFGSHDVTRTLSRFASQVFIAMPTAAGVETLDGAPTKVTALVRSFPDTWEDVNGDREPGADETAKVWDLAVAVESQGDSGLRAVVFGDESVFSDAALAVSQGNQQLALDAARWLVGDEDIAGEVESEEDVKIQHTREEDIAWFYLTILGVPALVLLFGFAINRRRRN